MDYLVNVFGWYLTCHQKSFTTKYASILIAHQNVYLKKKTDHQELMLMHLALVLRRSHRYGRVSYRDKLKINKKEPK